MTGNGREWPGNVHKPGTNREQTGNNGRVGVFLVRSMLRFQLQSFGGWPGGIFDRRPLFKRDIGNGLTLSPDLTRLEIGD